MTRKNVDVLISFFAYESLTLCFVLPTEVLAWLRLCPSSSSTLRFASTSFGIVVVTYYAHIFYVRLDHETGSHNLKHRCTAAGL
jgi:hypothetical protein